MCVYINNPLTDPGVRTRDAWWCKGETLGLAAPPPEAPHNYRDDFPDSTPQVQLAVR